MYNTVARFSRFFSNDLKHLSTWTTVAAAAALVLIGTLPVAASAADPVAAADRQAAEATVVRLLNQERADVGLRPLLVDSRVSAVARERSDDMTANDYFDHVSPSGIGAADLLDRDHVAWYAMGEIIAQAEEDTLAAAAAEVMRQWMDSSDHRAILTSSEYNYLGVGVSMAGAVSTWTVVFIQGPDRTDPTARLTKATSAAGSHSVALAWTGSDPELASLTAGMRSYDVAQRRAGGTTWTTLRSKTPGKKMSVRLGRGLRYEFRVRGRDAEGNVGSWSAVKVVTVR